MLIPRRPPFFFNAISVARWNIYKMNFPQLPNCCSLFDSNRSLLFCCLHLHANLWNSYKWGPIPRQAVSTLYDDSFLKISLANEILANKLVNNYSTCLNSKSGIFIIHHLHMYSYTFPCGICHHLPCRLSLVPHQMHASRKFIVVYLLSKMSYIARTMLKTLFKNFNFVWGRCTAGATAAAYKYFRCRIVLCLWKLFVNHFWYNNANNKQMRWREQTMFKPRTGLNRTSTTTTIVKKKYGRIHMHMLIFYLEKDLIFWWVSWIKIKYFCYPTSGSNFVHTIATIFWYLNNRLDARMRLNYLCIKWSPILLFESFYA